MLTQDARAVARRGQPELRTQDRPGGEEVRREAMIAWPRGRREAEKIFPKFRGGWPRGQREEEMTREKEGHPGRGENSASLRGKGQAESLGCRAVFVQVAFQRWRTGDANSENGDGKR